MSDQIYLWLISVMVRSILMKIENKCEENVLIAAAFCFS